MALPAEAAVRAERNEFISSLDKTQISDWMSRQ
jgi:hypothetical protein